VTLVDKEGASPTSLEAKWILPNKGRECSTYLKFITEFYHNLPKWTVFLHGHENTWHHMYDKTILELIDIAPKGKNTFQSLNGVWAERDRETYAEFWPVVEPWLGELPEGPAFFDCGAQFIVGRNRIKMLPKEFYEKLLNFVLKLERDKEFAIFMEGIWHYMWGQVWYMDPSPFETCDGTRVKIYNPYLKMNDLDIKIKYAPSIFDPEHVKAHKVAAAKWELEEAYKIITNFNSKLNEEKEELLGKGYNNDDIKIWFLKNKADYYINILQDAILAKERVVEELREDLIIDKIKNLENQLIY
jgi:hypothetical protein